MRSVLLVLSCCVASTSLAQTPDDKTERLRRRAEREARSNSTVGCKEFLAEARLACREVLTRELKVSCASLTTALSMSAKQAGGALFATGTPETDVKAANAACRVHLSSLEKSRKKAEAPLADAAGAPAACTELADALDRECFDVFAQRGVFPDACESVFQMLSFGHVTVAKLVREKAQADGRPGPDPVKRCDAPLDAWRQLCTKP